jgi:hypothetical protein
VAFTKIQTPNRQLGFCAQPSIIALLVAANFKHVVRSRQVQTFCAWSPRSMEVKTTAGQAVPGQKSSFKACKSAYNYECSRRRLL